MAGAYGRAGRTAVPPRAHLYSPGRADVANPPRGRVVRRGRGGPGPPVRPRTCPPAPPRPGPRGAVPGPAAAAPVALSVARPRPPARDVAVVALQMWAYVVAYEMPNDDP